jgi:protein gp37
MNPDWVRSIRDQCLAHGVAFHFKQWGGPNKKKTGRVLDGRTWDEQPTKIQPQSKRNLEVAAA